jgi:hypothetical protein
MVCDAHGIALQQPSRVAMPCVITLCACCVDQMGLRQLAVRPQGVLFVLRLGSLLMTRMLADEGRHPHLSVPCVVVLACTYQPCFCHCIKQPDEP